MDPSKGGGNGEEKPLRCLNCQNNHSDCQSSFQPLQVRGQHASRHEASN